ncbi:hypothetical protein GGS23DRAFT_585424 [Durotheca rogersii]|uniref:uncharacterized protein n=1 Tax=Durotheca rogersii TaxID=419775 RepID=UPI00221FE3F4|nr:uncharacterized protein GGS23DRAFT_585424 [Durotheca rogersii]KAI5859442.1 hypothetical protein GGS23DRAFT_585424 [Durotheca rogersii]
MVQQLGSLTYLFPQNGLGKAGFIFDTIFLFLCFVATGLRLWSRRLQKTSLRLNDWLILFSLIIFLPPYALQSVLFIKYGVGLNIDKILTIGGPGIMIRIWRLSYAMDIFWILLVTLIKLSVLHFYITIFRQPMFIRIVYATAALCAAFCIGALVEVVVLCPPRGGWRPDGLLFRCDNNSSILLTLGTIDLAIEILVIMLPMPVLWRLKLPTAKKVALTAIFGMGFLIIAFTSIRIRFILNLNDSGDISSPVLMQIFSAAMPLLGIINASLPVMAPALREIYRSSSRIWRKLRKSTDNSTDSRRSPVSPKPSGPEVSVVEKRNLSGAVEPNQIRITTAWEVSSTPASESDHARQGMYAYV